MAYCRSEHIPRADIPAMVRNLTQAMNLIRPYMREQRNKDDVLNKLSSEIDELNALVNN